MTGGMTVLQPAGDKKLTTPNYFFILDFRTFLHFHITSSSFNYFPFSSLSLVYHSLFFETSIFIFIFVNWKPQLKWMEHGKIKYINWLRLLINVMISTNDLFADTIKINRVLHFNGPRNTKMWVPFPTSLTFGFVYSLNFYPHIMT